MIINNRESDLSSICDRIAWILDNRCKGNLSQMARELELHEATLRSYVNGRVPKANILTKIVETYDIDGNWILTGKKLPKLPPYLTLTISYLMILLSMLTK